MHTLRPLLPLALLLTALPVGAAQPMWPHRWIPYWQPAAVEPQPQAKGETRSPAAEDEGDGAEESVSTDTRCDEPRLERQESQRQAVAAMREGNYAIAYHLWLPLADVGDAEALFAIGWMFHNGYGLVIDNRKTLALWERAAARDHPNSLLALGLLYASGDVGVDHNPARAVKLLLRAVNAGVEEARAHLSALLEREGSSLVDITSSWGESEWAVIGSTLRVTVDRANLRAGPGLDHRVVDVLVSGALLIERGEQGEWIEVSSPGSGSDLRWIHRSVIERVNGTPAPATPTPATTDD